MTTPSNPEDAIANEVIVAEEAPKVIPVKVPTFKNPPAFQRADTFKGGKATAVNNNRQRPGRAAARGR